MSGRPFPRGAAEHDSPSQLRGFGDSATKLPTTPTSLRRSDLGLGYVPSLFAKEGRRSALLTASDTTAQRTLIDVLQQGSQGGARQVLSEGVHNSPKLVADRRRSASLFGNAAPRQSVLLRQELFQRGVAPAQPKEPGQVRLPTKSSPIQRLPMSNGGMEKCGFKQHKGNHWMWMNDRGSQPNHVSAIRVNEEVREFHAKTQFKGNRSNRVDWKENSAGEFIGPLTTCKQAEEVWDSWHPAAEQAGKTTIELLRENRIKREGV